MRSGHKGRKKLRENSDVASLLKTHHMIFRSFVTFALAMKPALTIHRKADTRGPNITLTVSANDHPGELTEIASLEPLMAKYRGLKSYLDAIRNSEEVDHNLRAKSNFETNVHYRLIRITGAQYPDCHGSREPP